MGTRCSWLWDKRGNLAHRLCPIRELAGHTVNWEAVEAVREPPTMSDVTRILSQIESGDPSAAEQLLPLVYDELRQLASRCCRVNELSISGIRRCSSSAPMMLSSCSGDFDNRQIVMQCSMRSRQWAAIWLKYDGPSASPQFWDGGGEAFWPGRQYTEATLKCN